MGKNTYNLSHPSTGQCNEGLGGSGGGRVEPSETGGVRITGPSSASELPLSVSELLLSEMARVSRDRAHLLRNKVPLPESSLESLPESTIAVIQRARRKDGGGRNNQSKA